MKLLRLLDEHPGTTLIIGLRQNGGGASGVHSYVQEYLPQRKARDIEKTYVRISGVTVPAAMGPFPISCNELDATTIKERLQVNSLMGLLDNIQAQRYTLKWNAALLYRDSTHIIRKGNGK